MKDGLRGRIHAYRKVLVVLHFESIPRLINNLDVEEAVAHDLVLLIAANKVTILVEHLDVALKHNVQRVQLAILRCIEGLARDQILILHSLVDDVANELLEEGYGLLLRLYQLA